MKTDSYSALAPAKVNLFLHVGPVQANGRHKLDSLVMFAGEEAADRLDVMISDDLSMTITGPGMTNPDYIGPIHDNLVLRAARALQAETGTTKGAAFTLDKHLPIAAGIGGGSADAAAALRLLTDLWGTDPAAARKVAPDLGGDVPVALQGHAALMQGEGERVRDLVHWLREQRNDLQAPAISAVPEIAGVLDTLQALPDAQLTRMSGSGATCFALFETGDAARRAEAQLSAARPDWWIRATMLGDAV